MEKNSELFNVGQVSDATKIIEIDHEGKTLKFEVKKDMKLSERQKIVKKHANFDQEGNLVDIDWLALKSDLVWAYITDSNIPKFDVWKTNISPDLYDKIEEKILQIDEDDLLDKKK